jgi:hypothetical protein
MKTLIALPIFALALALSGCVTRCTVHDEARRSVQFENTASAQTFYDAYLRLYHAHPSGGYFAVGLPLPYEHVKRNSENVLFNKAVARGDTNHDNLISAAEARAFAERADALNGATTQPSLARSAPNPALAIATPETVVSPFPPTTSANSNPDPLRLLRSAKGYMPDVIDRPRLLIRYRHAG